MFHEENIAPFEDVTSAVSQQKSCNPMPVNPHRSNHEVNGDYCGPAFHAAAVNRLDHLLGKLENLLAEFEARVGASERARNYTQLALDISARSAFRSAMLQVRIERDLQEREAVRVWQEAAEAAKHLAERVHEELEGSILGELPHDGWSVTIFGIEATVVPDLTGNFWSLVEGERQIDFDILEPTDFTFFCEELEEAGDRILESVQRALVERGELEEVPRGNRCRSRGRPATPSPPTWNSPS
jgi:hypothetical protein